MTFSMQAIPDDYFQAPYDLEYEKTMEKRMVDGIDAFLSEYTVKVANERHTYWNRQFDSPESYNTSVDPNRQHLRQIIGAVDQRESVRLVWEGLPGDGGILGETSKCTIHRVRWTVVEGLESEGLLLLPKGKIKASAIVVPDADELPEEYAGLVQGNAIALQMVEQGTQVLIPTLISRGTTYSGGDHYTPSNPWLSGGDPVSIWTNLTHREWIHRQGYIMGRHIIGMEVQKILAAVDWFSSQPETRNLPIGVMGYGEGGLVAFYSSAIDTRIDASWISGYFGPRIDLWREPIYRNVWGLLKEFGDAEIAGLILPRKLIIETAAVPSVSEPLPAKKGQRNFALPGKLITPSDEEVEKEVRRLKNIFSESSVIKPKIDLITADKHGSDDALAAFANQLGIRVKSGAKTEIKSNRFNFIDTEDRQRRVFYNMQDFLQDKIPGSERNRYAFLRGDFSSPETWNKDMEPYRKLFHEELVGIIPEELKAMNPKIRQVYDTPGWKGYEVILDVWDEVFSWGVLAVPNDIKEGEKRPAVVLQHGIGGLPSTPIRVKSYNRVLPALVNRGFVVFSPHNPYQFNVRRANPVKASVFSIIISQHRQILNYLDSLEFVDGDRIAFYGKSWGGRSAQRIPIVLDGYSAIISSAYFNDWVKKIVSTEYRNSYFFEDSPGVYEWNMANTFTHAEMALLIAPRPIMVESGYTDGVAAHEMVAYEFAKVRRLYYAMGIADRVHLEFFMGGHEINGEGTFDFLHEYLDWPAPVKPSDAQLISRE